MRRLLLIFALILARAGTARAGFPATDPNLVAWYKMNDELATTAVVNSIGSPNGVAQQNTSILHTTGKIGGALTFNGSTDYIGTGAAFAATFRDSFTINIWFYTDYRNPEIPGEFIPNSFFGVSDTSDHSRVAFEIVDDGSSIFMYQSNNVNAYAQTEIGAIAINQWQMATLVFEKLSSTTGKTTCYLDGVSVATSGVVSVNSSLYVSGYYLWLGATNANGSSVDWLTGALDDVMIFNKALSESEIASLYHYGLSGCNCMGME